MIKRNIPNFVTLLNLLSGCLAITKVASGDPETAAYFIFVAAFFDFADGFTARLLRVHSPMGKELDSLADVVSFGVAPAMVVRDLANMSSAWENVQSYIFFMLPLFAAWRLAKFNIDTRQSDSFRGLPTPAAGITAASLPLIVQQYPAYADSIVRPAFLIGFTVLLSLLMVLPIPLFALKFKTYGFQENAVRYLFLTGALLLILFFRTASVPFILLLYISLSLIQKFGKR